MSINPYASREALPAQEDNFSAWYNEVIRQGGLIDEGVSPGTWALLPAATRMWNSIRGAMTEDMDEMGVDEVTLPSLFPLSLLEKEGDHVEGFAPEVFLVNQAGRKELDEPLVLRPTSEVVVSEYFKKWIGSYRDLPAKINQWGSVFRSERRPRPFLRTSEFLWQEGHAAHATPEEAQAHAEEMGAFYQQFLTRVLSISGVSGQKSENEKFAGAVSTHTIEALYGGRSLQLATSHNLSDTFSRAHDIQFTNSAGEFSRIYQTSWGSTTRMIGAVVMAHGDNKGLVLPPQIAPTQVSVIPAWRNESDRADVAGYAARLNESLQARSRVAQRDVGDRLGAVRFAEEKAGTPIQVLIGSREIEGQYASVHIRHSGEKVMVALDAIEQEIPRLLAGIAIDLLAKAEDKQTESVVDVTIKDELIEAASSGKFARAGWSGSAVDEKALKAETGITLRVHPSGQDDTLNDPLTNRPGKATLFAKSY